MAILHSYIKLPEGSNKGGDLQMTYNFTSKHTLWLFDMTEAMARYR